MSSSRARIAKRNAAAKNGDHKIPGPIDIMLTGRPVGVLRVNQTFGAPSSPVGRYSSAYSFEKSRSRSMASERRYE